MRRQRNVNPRFPHKCVVYRVDGEDSFGNKGEETVLYGSRECMGQDCMICSGTDTDCYGRLCKECPGRCRKECSTSKRTFIADKTERVKTGDFRLALPGQVRGITTGCYVDVEDLQGRFDKCAVTGAWATNMGTTVFFNMPSE